MKMNMTKKEYEKYAQQKAPKSKFVKNMFWAFVIGGLICVIGQAVNNFFRSRGMDIEQAAGATAIIMIFLGALLTGLNYYDNIAKLAGAGTLVPITGFANAIVSPAMEFRSEGYILGIGAKMFVIAGPVLVFGTVSSVIAGIIYYFIK